MEYMYLQKVEAREGRGGGRCGGRGDEGRG